MKLLTLTPDGQVLAGECSKRQLAAASEGVCPACGSLDIARTEEPVPTKVLISELENPRASWWSSCGWGICMGCTWAQAFAVTMAGDELEPTLMRVLPRQVAS